MATYDIVWINFYLVIFFRRLDMYYNIIKLEINDNEARGTKFIILVSHEAVANNYKFKSKKVYIKRILLRRCY